MTNRTCLILLTTFGLILPAAFVRADEITEFFDSLYGDEAKRIAATPSKDDDVEFASQLLTASGDISDQPRVVVLLCQKAYEFAMRDVKGYPIAIKAQQLLAQTAPDQKPQSLEAIVLIHRRIYASSRGTAKTEAAHGLLAALLEAAQAAGNAGQWDRAGLLYRQAIPVASFVRSDKRPAITLAIKQAAARDRMVKQIQELEAKLKANPKDQSAADQLVMLYIVELDQPSKALEPALAGSDAKTGELVLLASTETEKLSDQNCLDLADWYRKLAKSASPDAKPAMLIRAEKYFEMFLELHPQKDLYKTKATMLLKQVQTQLATIRPAGSLLGNRPANSSSGPQLIKPGQSFDLISVTDPAADSIVGNWVRQGSALGLVKPTPMSLVRVPVLPQGSYEINLEFTRTDGQYYVGVLLPVGKASTAMVLSWSKDPVSRLYDLEGKESKNETIRPNPLINGRRYKLIIRVAMLPEDQAQIQALLDGKEILQWKGAQSRLRPGKGFRLPSPTTLALGAYSNTTVFHSVRLKMISGTAKVLDARARYLARIEANLLSKGSKFEKYPGLSGWAGEVSLPSIIASASKQTFKIPGTVEPGNFVVHPGSSVGVAIGWKSPIDGTVNIIGGIADAHHSGNGVVWRMHQLGKSMTPLAGGAIDMGQTQPFTEGAGGEALGRVKVAKGDILQLLVLPRKDHSSDLTRIEWRISEVGGRGRKWDLAREVAPNPLEDGKGNPHSDSLGNADVWYFYGVPPGDIPHDEGKPFKKGDRKPEKKPDKKPDKKPGKKPDKKPGKLGKPGKKPKRD